MLATKHDKLPLIGPALHRELCLRVDDVVIDTDRFGTFSGDVARTGTPWETAVAKARAGMDAAGCRLGIASEGSIGADPAVPFVVSAVELVVFVDDERGIVVGESERSFDVVTVGAEVAPGDDLADVLRRGRFPDHAVIVRPASGAVAPIAKGLRALVDAERAIAVAAAASTDGRARIETDLRAHRCPSRRPVIERAAARLAARLATRCPACSSPGWGVVDVEVGLPCDWCGHEVPLPRAEVLGCPACEHDDAQPIAASTADPSRCEWCNP